MSEKGNPHLDRINSIKEKFLDGFDDRDKAVVQEWEKSVKDLMVREKLGENKALIAILQELLKDVKEMNQLLLTADSKQLSDTDRNRIIDKKRLYVDFLLKFDSTQIQRELAAVEKSIEELAPLDQNVG